MQRVEKPYSRTEARIAQDHILSAITGAALVEREAGRVKIAEAIADYGASIARRWNIADVAGLPGTFAASTRGRTILPDRMENR
jgi:hypothetical protein